MLSTVSDAVSHYQYREEEIAAAEEKAWLYLLDSLRERYATEIDAFISPDVLIWRMPKVAP